MLRHWVLVPAFRGSNPLPPAKKNESHFVDSFFVFISVIAIIFRPPLNYGFFEHSAIAATIFEYLTDTLPPEPRSVEVVIL